MKIISHYLEGNFVAENFSIMVLFFFFVLFGTIVYQILSGSKEHNEEMGKLPLD